MFRNLMVAVPVAMIAIGGSTACATKKFVRTSVGEVNDKVDSLGRSLEETQERTRQNETKISEVDQKAQAAAGAAGQARTAADQANTAAGAAANTANGAVARTAESRQGRSKRLVFEVVLSEDQGNFKFGKAELPDEAKSQARRDDDADQGRSEGRLLRDRRAH